MGKTQTSIKPGIIKRPLVGDCARLLSPWPWAGCSVVLHGKALTSRWIKDPSEPADPDLLFIHRGLFPKMDFKITGTPVPDSSVLCLSLTQYVPRGPPNGQSQGPSALSFFQVAHLTTESRGLGPRVSWPCCKLGTWGQRDTYFGGESLHESHQGGGVPESTVFPTLFPREGETNGS